MAVFLDVGFERANLERIAMEAGVTKPTVYSHFGSKIGLLEAVARWQSELALKQFSPTLASSGNVRRDLTEFSKIFLFNLLRPESIRMHRFAIVEAMTHPELVAPLLASGPQKMTDALQRYLAAETKAGRLQCRNTELAAQHLIGLLCGVDFIGMLISQIVPSESELKKRIDSAVTVFLSAYRKGES